MTLNQHIIEHKLAVTITILTPQKDSEIMEVEASLVAGMIATITMFPAYVTYSSYCPEQHIGCKRKCQGLKLRVDFRSQRS